MPDPIPIGKLPPDHLARLLAERNIEALVLARLFGADATTDAFFVAFKIPNFLRRLFAEGAFATAFVPVLTEYRTTREFSDLKTFVDHVAGTLGLVLLAVTLIGVVGAPILILIFAPGFIDEPCNHHGQLDNPCDVTACIGRFFINGSGDVTNPEGRSTIWSGQSVDFTNANFKTNILSPDGAGIVETSNRNTFGPDVVQNDGNLSTMTGDEFFSSFFG